MQLVPGIGVVMPKNKCYCPYQGHTCAIRDACSLFPNMMSCKGFDIRANIGIIKWSLLFVTLFGEINCVFTNSSIVFSRNHFSVISLNMIPANGAYAPLATTNFAVGHKKNGFYRLLINVHYVNLKLSSLAITEPMGIHEAQVGWGRAIHYCVNGDL